MFSDNMYSKLAMVEAEEQARKATTQWLVKKLVQELDADHLLNVIDDYSAGYNDAIESAIKMIKGYVK